MKTLLLILMLSLPLSAQESIFYDLWEESEVDAFPVPNGIDSEHQADIFTYRYPLKWQQEFKQKTNAVLVSVGSVGSKDFFVDHRVKVGVPLGEDWRLRFVYYDFSDLEQKEQSLWYNFLYQPSHKHHWNFFGQTRGEKRENDTGFTYSYLLPAKRRVGFTWLRVNYDYNARNPGDRRFEGSRFPFVYQVFYESQGVGSYFLISSRIDHNATLNAPSENFRYDRKFQRHLLQFYNSTWSVYLEIDDQTESKNAVDFSSQEDWRRQRLISNVEYELNPKYGLGMELAFRRWQSQSGSLTHHNYGPFVSYHLQPADETHWNFQYMTNFFRATGDLNLNGSGNDAFLVEHKLNCIYSKVFNEQAKMDFVFTFDMDRFGSEETWDGGNIKFSATF